MQPLLLFISLLLSLLALSFNATTYAHNKNTEGMYLVIALATLSILLALIAALRKPRTRWPLVALAVILAMNLLHIAAAARTLWH